LGESLRNYLTLQQLTLPGGIATILLGKKATCEHHYALSRNWHGEYFGPVTDPTPRTA
jgi:hypothetical protein